MKSMKPLDTLPHNLKGILDYTEDPIVSVDIIGNKKLMRI
jgi:glyceraldehyde-3-phosphate dehydrogenase/erythrose-4-phosphate dehydrogenase